jgi:HPt (histidine-containing phosphotransfer) domain-containing protein
MSSNVSSRARNEQALTTETRLPIQPLGPSVRINRPALDRQELTTRVGGDEVFVNELCALFCTSSRTLLRELQAALELADAQRIIANAHTLKGAALNIGAPMIAWQAWWLGEAARERDWGLAAAAWKTLREELVRLEAEVDQTGKAR